jgi:hypothetical protein
VHLILVEFCIMCTPVNLFSDPNTGKGHTNFSPSEGSMRAGGLPDPLLRSRGKCKRYNSMDDPNPRRNGKMGL